jgi:hypothetical protein
LIQMLQELRPIYKTRNQFCSCTTVFHPAIAMSKR